MSLYLIRIIARYEMTILLRSWFFRIFAGLAILGLGIFNIAIHVASSGAPWIYRALSCATPYANLIILNVGQAIVAIFLASEFLKQDRKNDTVEVIYARSMSNGDYILGKTLGILLVFLVLNLIILFLGIGFSFLSHDSSRSFLAFLAYPLFISLPTLLYILGLSFFLMVLFKNQAITFILLLGYIALTIFYLNTKAFHVFDFIAYHVPMMYSSIGGFGNIQEILLIRGIYFFAGIAFIFITVYKLPRLSQSLTFELLPVFFAVFFFAISGLFAYKYLNLKQNSRAFKEHIIELNNRNANYPIVTVSKCSLELVHLSQTISVKAILDVQNQTQKNIDTLIFSLNPSLKVNSVSVGDKKIQFSREVHLVKIPLLTRLQPRELLNLSLEYSGSINEDVCFVDQDLDDFKDNFTFEVLNVRKRFAFIQSDFVCLTNESLWYPTAGVPYANVKPMFYFPNFTQFTLKVKTSQGLTAISQGMESELQNGTFEFKPEYPLPKISLLIGNYKRYSLKIDSIDYKLFTINGNQYFESFFDQITDTIPAVIKGLKQEYEVQTGLKYPFKRFSLAEVPVLFALDKHVYSMSSDAVQPEMIFYPEKGVLFNESDFKKRKIRTEKDMKRNNEEVLPEEMQILMFQKFVRSNFMAQAKTWFRYDDVVDGNTYSLFPEYYTFINRFYSEKWPVLGLAIESWLKEKTGMSGSSVVWFFEGMSKSERINVELKQASLKQLMKTGLVTKKDEDHPVSLKDVILAKGTHLVNVWSAGFCKEEFDNILYGLIRKNQYKNLSFDVLDSVIQENFHKSLQPDIEQWFMEQKLPGFILKDLSTYKVVQKETTKFQVRFKLSNPEPVDGLITIIVELNDPKRASTQEWWDNEVKADFSKSIFLPAHSAKEIGFAFNNLPLRMSVNTYISENLPNNLNFDFTGFNEIKKVPAMDSIIEIPAFNDLESKNEIIVDNEDSGFSYEELEDQAYLKSILYKKENNKFEYSRVRSWDLPGKWVPVLQSGFYGKYIHSAMYTKSGNGDRKALWKTPLQEGGFYDIYFHYITIEMDRHDKRKTGNYSFTVFHDGGAEKLTMTFDEKENGWTYLGSYFISSGSGKVELSNKSTGDAVFADAIKWVKAK
jgi:ABC-type transport system involved in multi-copper enzyme maturation permease subunit